MRAERGNISLPSLERKPRARARPYPSPGGITGRAETGRITAPQAPGGASLAVAPVASGRNAVRTVPPLTADPAQAGPEHLRGALAVPAY